MIHLRKIVFLYMTLLDFLLAVFFFYDTLERLFGVLYTVHDIFVYLLAVLHSFITDFLAGQLFNEDGAAVWGTSVHTPDSLEYHARWGMLGEDVRDVEVVWSSAHRGMLGRLLLEQLQELERETLRLSSKGRGGRANPDTLAWNDVAWEVPWHKMVGEVRKSSHHVKASVCTHF